MIQIANLTKSYAKGSIKAVDDLSLIVKPGEIFGFLGPNGAGKTTTIKMLVGLLTPDDGRISLNGHEMKQDPIGTRMQIGYVPDNPDMFERLTGIEYLNFMADIYGVNAAERKARMDHFLDVFEMKNAAGDLIKSYSHGMRQKIIITGALVHNPALWILDEPLTGLDPKSAHLLKGLMREHCDQGNTVFFSTHVLEVAEKLCDRIGIINHGRLVAIGTLDELRRQEGAESLESIFLELTEE